MFKSNCQVTLFRRTLLPDGTGSCDGGTPVGAFFMEQYRTKKDGSVEDHSEILLGAESVPAPGDEVEIKGLRRTLARVLCCTGVDGTVKCYRCSFLRS